MRSKGSRFTLVVWGLRVCSLDVAFTSATVRNRPQPFATVRARSLWLCLLGSAKGVTFGGFTCGVASFRVAGMALRDIQTCFVTCRKSFSVAGAILLHTFAMFSEDVFQFSWQAQHFGRVHLHFALWFLKIALSGLGMGWIKWWQGANSVAGVAFCEMCWKLMEALHETSILR